MNDKLVNASILVTAYCRCNSKKGARKPEEAEMELINDPRKGDCNG